MNTDKPRPRLYASQAEFQKLTQDVAALGERLAQVEATLAQVQAVVARMSKQDQQKVDRKGLERPYQCLILGSNERR